GAKTVGRGAAGPVGVAIHFARRGPRCRADLAVLCQPRRLDVAFAFAVRQKHVPAIGQAVLSREIDTPLSSERHLPIKRHDFLHVRGGHIDRVPYARALEHGAPDFAALLAKINFGTRDTPLVAFSRQCDTDVLLAVLEYSHDDGVLLSGEMQQE